MTRKWPSLYEAFENGRIDEKRLRDSFAHYLPKPDPGKRGIDASSIARPDAITEASRTAQHVHNLPECKHPTTFGWQFSTAVVLTDPESRLDLHSGSTTGGIADHSHRGS